MDGLRIRCATRSDVDAVLPFWREAAEGTSISGDAEGVARLSRATPAPSSSPSGTARWWGP